MEHLLHDLKFQKKLTEIAEQTGKSYERVIEAARGYLEELYTIHQPIANLIGAQGAQYILSRGYKKTIDINPAEIKKITRLSRDHSIAFVMTHKTYIDMFVLAVVLVRHGLPIPYTFAGINMSFMGLGQFGRQTGVIFIRRSFRENLVYKACLRHFIASLVDQKSHFMWAIEGTRSRTGKLVWPKMGILNGGRIGQQGSPRTRMAHLQGRVWMCEAAPDHPIDPRWAVITTRMERGGRCIRVLSDTAPDAAFQLVDPDLNDVYFTALMAQPVAIAV